MTTADNQIYIYIVQRLNKSWKPREQSTAYLVSIWIRFRYRALEESRNAQHESTPDDDKYDGLGPGPAAESGGVEGHADGDVPLDRQQDDQPGLAQTDGVSRREERAEEVSEDGRISGNSHVSEGSQ